MAFINVGCTGTPVDASYPLNRHFWYCTSMSHLLMNDSDGLAEKLRVDLYRNENFQTEILC